MINGLKVFLVVLLTISIRYSSASNNYIDSLLQVISVSTDSLKVVNLNKIASYYSRDKIDSALFFAKKALQIANKTNNPFLISKAYYTHGLIYLRNGEYEKNLYYRKLVLEERLKTNDSNLIGRSYMDIGGAYVYLEKNKYALENHIKALEIFKKLNIADRIAACYVNIGNVYSFQNNYISAIDYYLMAENMSDTAMDKEILSTIYNNLGAIYESIKDYKNAKIYLNKSLQLRLQNNQKEDIAMAYGNLGVIYSSLEEHNEAIIYLNKAINLYKELNDLDGVASYQANLATVYLKIGMKDSAFHYITLGLPIAEKLQLRKMRIIYYEMLVDIYADKREFEKAYIFSNKLKLLKDSIAFDEQSREINELKSKYENSQKQKEIDDLEKQQIIQHHELEKQKIYKNLVILGAGFLFLIVLFIYNKYKTNKRSSELFKAHNKEIARKNKEITDSIMYAKRIQNAILISPKTIKEYLPQGFIIYKPKDVVSGDFYWFQKTANILLFAAADCTGHGVPGAMVSVICNNALNRSVKEFGLLKPGEILDKTRELVVQEFEKSDEDVKDGMDISLASLQLYEHVEGKNQKIKLQWAGANNPLWVIKPTNNSTPLQNFSFQLSEIKPNKQPIGKIDNPILFTTHTIELQKNDTIYIFTDGYQDQFGGEKGKKFKAAKLKELLLSIQNKSMDEQKDIILTTFDAWKGKLEQVDDICIIGIRV